MMKTIFSKGIRRERKMKEKEKIDLSNRVGDISMNIEKIKDLSVLLSEHFNEENFAPIRRMRKEGKESRLELLSSEVMIFRRNFEEYGTLLFEIIEKLQKTQKDCDDIMKEISQSIGNKEGEMKKDDK